MIAKPLGAEPATGLCSPTRGHVHDLRNLFAVVASAKSLLEREPTKSRQEQIIAALGRVAEEGAALTTALLTGVAELGRAVCDPAETLRQVEPLLAAMGGPRCDIRLDIAFSKRRVRIARSDLEAIVLELIANARSARASAITIRGRLRRERFWLLVHDDGAGFDVPARLANPGPGPSPRNPRGTGLRRVAGAVENAHGLMHIRSRPGHGTTIALILPTLLNPRWKPERTTLDKAHAAAQPMVAPSPA